MGGEGGAAFLEELEDAGGAFDDLALEIGPGVAPLDLVAAAAAFNRPPLTRKDSAGQAGVRAYLEAQPAPAREVLAALLGKYVEEGVDELASLGLLQVPPLVAMGTVMEIFGRFGGRGDYLQAVRGLVGRLYGVG